MTTDTIAQQDASAPTDIAEHLQAPTAAVRVSFTWFGARNSQKAQHCRFGNGTDGHGIALLTAYSVTLYRYSPKLWGADNEKVTRPSVSILVLKSLPWPQRC